MYPLSTKYQLMAKTNSAMISRISLVIEAFDNLDDMALV